MLLFLYKCSSCNATVEKVQQTNIPPKKCGVCGEKGTFEKVSSVPSFVAEYTNWKSKVKDESKHSIF